MPRSGMVNEAWALGDAHVLRIMFAEDADNEVEREVFVVPLAREAGIPTPELVAYDFTCSLAPKPYTIYRRAKGALLGYCAQDPMAFVPAYRELGRQVARMQGVSLTPEIICHLGRTESQEGELQLQEALAGGVISPSDADIARELFGILAEQMQESGGQYLLHRDIHPWNVFVDPSSGELTSIIDWGDAAYGGQEIEFASMPLYAVPPMLEGFVQEGGTMDIAFLARSLYEGVKLSLFELLELPESQFDRRYWRYPGSWQLMRDQVLQIIGSGPIPSPIRL